MSVWREEVTVPATAENGWRGESEVRESFKGCTLDSGSYGPGWLCSDYGWYKQASVWDGERVVKVTYLTEFTNLPGCKAVPDATPEVRAKAEAWFYAQKRAAAEQSARRDAESVKKGVPVVVVKGRKVPVGTSGTAFWVGPTRYGTRVGLKTDSGEVFWTDYNNVKPTESYVSERMSAFNDSWR